MSFQSIHLTFALVVILAGGSRASAQGATAAEVAQLRADLQRALVRIELLERLVLAAPPAAAARPSQALSRSLLTPSIVDEAPSEPTTTRRAASAPTAYMRGPKGGCYTYSGSGRKRYVDRSLCN